MQNYLLGGRDHYIVDREGALRAAERMPFLESAVRHERLYVLLMVQGPGHRGHPAAGRLRLRPSP
ncbi:SAM-dependent methyltransferase [Streptomyces scabiei]